MGRSTQCTARDPSHPVVGVRLCRGSASGGDAMLTGTMVLKRAMVLTRARTVHKCIGRRRRSGCCSTTRHVVHGRAVVVDGHRQLRCNDRRVRHRRHRSGATGHRTGRRRRVGRRTDDHRPGASDDRGHRRRSCGRRRHRARGRLVVLGDGAAAELNNATVAMDRCAQVESAASGDGVAAPAALPHTGATVQLGGSLAGLVAVGMGSALIVVGRRRAAV